MVQPKDFSDHKHFPGETGNFLDVALFAAEKVDLIPLLVLFFGLFILTCLRYWKDPLDSVFLALFFGIDWLLLRLLPLFNRSFGPAKPTLLILALARLVFSFFPTPWSWVFQGIGTLLLIYGFWIEPFQIRLTHQKFISPKLTPTTRPFRLLHLGDLHIERLSVREKRLNAFINRLSPDLICFSGDFLNLSYRRDALAIQTARQVIGQWKAPLGVYLVSGSPAVDYPDVVSTIVSGLPVTWLQNQVVEIDFENNLIQLVGMTCTHRPFRDTPILKELLPDKNGLKILLYHSPDLAPQASEMDVDLQLSGHTHGGQVRIPFWGALFTGSLYGKAFEAGRYQLQKMVLYISRGIGMEGAAAPRVRFLCPPEIILWEISN